MVSRNKSLAQREHSKSTSPFAQQRSSQQRSSQQPSEQQVVGGDRLWGVSAGMLGMMLVWSLLDPVDATSVFQGEALAQNLGWLVVALLTALASVRCGVGLRMGPKVWLWLLCLGWFLGATWLAGSGNNPRVGWHGFWQVVALAACFLSARTLLVGPRSQRMALLILLVGCVGLAGQGLHQVFSEFPAQRARYLADPEGVIAENPDLDLPAGSPMRKRFEDRLLYSSEPYATYALANSLAVLLSGGLVWLWGLGIARWHSPSTSSPELAESLAESSARKPSVPPWAGWGGLALAAGIVALCWFLTRSRVSYVALGVGGLAWYLASDRRSQEQRRLLSWLLGVGVVASALGGMWLWRNDSLVLSEAPKSLSYRLEYWAATLAMLRDHAGWGIGLGNFQNYYPLYKLPQASEIVADPHNWILDVCVSLSFPVGVGVIVWVAWQLRGAIFSTDEEAQGNAVPEQAERLQQLDLIAERGLLFGALGGGVTCALGLAWLSGLELTVLLVAWLLASLCMAAFFDRWQAEASALQGISRAAVLTMLTCLLVSGSWQASGIAVPLLIGFVLANGVGGVQVCRSAATAPSGISGLYQWRAAVWPAFGLVCFWVQSWQPVTASWGLMQQSQAARTIERQVALIEAAAEADQLDTEPLRWRAQMLAIQAVGSNLGSFPSLADQTLTAFDSWLARDSTKPLNWELAGKNSLELAGKARDVGLPEQKWVSAASGYYSQGVARYPSSVAMHAQLAVVLALQQRWDEVLGELRLVDELDATTPHADRKLASQQLWLPLLPAGAEPVFAQQQPRVEAEPMLDWLRTQLSEQRELRH